MPELPEVECVRRSLLPVLVGRRVDAIMVHRAGVVRPWSKTGQATNTTPPEALPGPLMTGLTFAAIERHGKQLAIMGAGENGKTGCVVVHLGMSGQLRWSPAPHAGTADPAPPHTHVVWRLTDGELRFTDPRRFGGLWCYPSPERAHSERWARLGPDALSATPARLHAALGRTRRGLKPALLDQQVVAGLGNIYVDELLFGAKLYPAKPAATVTRAQAASLARRMRTLLARAIEAGGSTLRDYVDGSGSAGGYQHAHRVYGRSGLRCVRRGCGASLSTCTLAGRTTVYCPACQRAD